MRRTTPALLLAAVVCLATTPGPAHAGNLPLQITSDTTLTHASGPYHLVGNTTVGSGVTVRIEPGAEVIADGDYEVRVEGTLLAAGVDGAPVVFRPLDDKATGAWRGLLFTTTGRGELHQTVVRGARTNITVAGGLVDMVGCRTEQAQHDGMYVFGDAYVRATNCQFLGNGRRGLYIETTSPSGSIWRSYFIGNGEYPVYAKATCAEMLRRGNRYADNGIQRIGVSCSAADGIGDVDVWYDQDGLAYDLTAGTGSKQLTISGRLHLEAGITILGTDIEVTGSLHTAGSADQPVTITAPTSTAGTWKGITLRPGSNAQLRSTVIRYAENAVTADGASLSLDNCSVLDSQYDGVRCYGNTWLHISGSRFERNGRDGLRIEGWDGASLPVRNCTFVGNHRFPIYTHAAAAQLLGTGNLYQTNGKQRIGVACHLDPDLASGLHTWTAQGVPFDLTARSDAVTLHLGSGAALNLGSGVTVLGGGIHVRGQLNIVATAADPCRLDAATQSPQSGDWEGIYFDSGATGIVRGADIRRANHGLEVHSASPRIEQCYITASRYDGLRFTGTAASVVTETWTVGNGRYGVYIADTAQPNFGNTANADPYDDGLNHIHDNGPYQVYNFSSLDIYMHNNWWGTTDLGELRAATYDYYDNPAVGRLLIEQMRAYGLGGPGTSVARPLLAIAAAAVQPLGNGAMQLSYRVSADSEVQVRILNIAGRPVAELAQQATGDRLMTLLWDGRGSHGTAVPGGRYLCILHAYGEDGQSAQVVVPLDR